MLSQEASYFRACSLDSRRGVEACPVWPFGNHAGLQPDWVRADAATPSVRLVLRLGTESRIVGQLVGRPRDSKDANDARQFVDAYKGQGFAPLSTHQHRVEDTVLGALAIASDNDKPVFLHLDNDWSGHQMASALHLMAGANVPVTVALRYAKGDLAASESSTVQHWLEIATRFKVSPTKIHRSLAYLSGTGAHRIFVLAKFSLPVAMEESARAFLHPNKPALTESYVRRMVAADTVRQTGTTSYQMGLQHVFLAASYFSFVA